MATNASRLTAIKLIHTLVWAVFAAAIVAIPICAHRSAFTLAWALIGFVMLEVVVLLANRMRCPLTDVAAKYTEAREDNFDIYLPNWLARHNQRIFGTLYGLGIVYVLLMQFVPAQAA